MKYTKDEINKILNIRGADGELIDVFDLHGVLFIGNCLQEHTPTGVKTMWNIDRRFIMESEHSLPIPYDDFEGCENEEDVHEKFSELLHEALEKKLLQGTLFSVLGENV